MGCNSTYRLRYWNNHAVITSYHFLAWSCNSTYRLRYWNYNYSQIFWNRFVIVATVLTACGIETWQRLWHRQLRCLCMLQQYLPLAVLKLLHLALGNHQQSLQQYLPLAVLKQKYRYFLYLAYISCNSTYRLRYWNDFHASRLLPLLLHVATVLTACGIETFNFFMISRFFIPCCCNSTYRLRYWNSSLAGKCNKPLYHVATVLTACGIETRNNL